MIKPIICIVRENKKSGQRLVTIPREVYSIKKGDYVRIEKIKVEEAYT